MDRLEIRVGSLEMVYASFSGPCVANISKEHSKPSVFVLFACIVFGTYCIACDSEIMALMWLIGQNKTDSGA